MLPRVEAAHGSGARMHGSSKRSRLPTDRDEYALRQAALVEALVAGGRLPDGFDGERALAVMDVLVRKRARSIRRAWPALVRSLGSNFEAMFVAFAAATSPPPDGDVVSDGFA